jgi:hypothetical protein
VQRKPLFNLINQGYRPRSRTLAGFIGAGRLPICRHRRHHRFIAVGRQIRKDVIETETVVMRSVTGTVRYIKAEHRQLEKFHLD